MAKDARRTAKKRPGGLLLRLVLLLVLVAIGWQLNSLRIQVSEAQAEKDRTAQQVEALKQSNEALRADIAEGATDEKMKDLARSELGWTIPTNTYFTISQTNICAIDF